ncbi:uncharacterized protein LOC128134287 [Lactuca sativa]|uniref:uncharacterized protein LOC128134287 n=1 Tax=Lactuca sativa TaxID=4236 RepID=UPI0022AF33AF|nr:uncharacterized protein LOC128134287 [Lactuca sativa]
MMSAKDAMQKIFPKTSRVTTFISNLFEQYMLLFDEPQTTIDSKSTAKDKKVDNLKQIIDDAAQKMAADLPKVTKRPHVSEPSSDRPNVQGEGPTLQHDQGSSFQGENSTSQSSSSTESPNEREDTNPDSKQSDEDDDEPVSKRHLKAVNDKLNQLFSSSSSGAYSDAALKALFSSVVQEHNASLTGAAKAIDASTSQRQKTSLAVEASTK